MRTRHCRSYHQTTLNVERESAHERERERAREREREKTEKTEKTEERK